jgi:hypothetical protein
MWHRIVWYTTFGAEYCLHLQVTPRAYIPPKRRCTRLRLQKFL